MAIRWSEPKGIGSYAYDCGHCGKHTGPNLGYYGTYHGAHGQGQVAIAICTYCQGPTYFDIEGNQIPGVPTGNHIEHVPTAVSGLYDEARRCMSVAAPTAAVMACRKVLMNLAVQEGADENLKFVEYVNWLEENHFLPPRGRAWVDQIKDVGNEANHEIPDISPEQASEIVAFTEGLLRFLYEFPARAGAGVADGEDTG